MLLDNVIELARVAYINSRDLLPAGTFVYAKSKTKSKTRDMLLKMFTENSTRFANFVTDHAAVVGLCAGAIGALTFLQRSGILYTLLNKVDAKSSRHGGELVAEVLKAHGVKFIFTLSGGHISPILVATEKIGIRVIDTRHEVTAVFAADAVSRLSGTVGVAVVTAGPGVTNTVTALKNAQMAESPILLIGGAASTLLKGRGSLQDIDQLALLKSLCKFTATIHHVRDIVPVLRKALQVAQSDTPGPVFVEMPIDTLYEYKTVQSELGAQSTGPPKSLSQRLVNWYLKHYLASLFAGAWNETDKTPLPVNVRFATQSQLQQCAEMLSRAKRPLILLGSQVTLPPTPTNIVADALTRLGVPCFLGGMSRGMLGRDSHLQMRQKRREALKDADLVILAGAVCDFRLSYGRILSKRSKIVIINRNKEQISKNTDMFWKPTLAVQADVASFIVLLSKMAAPCLCDPDWINSLRARDSEKEAANVQLAGEPTDQHLNPIKVLQTVDSLLPTDSLLVADGGDFVGTAAYILRPRGPLTWLDPGAFGTLGVGGGFALGAKLCRPDHEVWIIYGDGSLGFSVAEFDTFTRHKTPVIALVGNDASWMMIERAQMSIFQSKVACSLAFSDYHTVAVGFGGKGYKVDRSNEESLSAILRQAQEDSRNGSSVLINCLVGKTSFREGSLSV